MREAVALRDDEGGPAAPVRRAVTCCPMSIRCRPTLPRRSGRHAALGMVFKLIEPAQTRWRAVNAPHLVALVRAGPHFERGVLVERQDQAA